MPDTSPILALPFLLPSQAQKHVTHNEALRRLDIVVQLTVEGFDAVTPPAAPEEGDIHALGISPVAAWAGQAGALAAWLDGTWHFVPPLDGWRAWGRSEQQLRVWDGGSWVLPLMPSENLPGLGVGTTSDATNRLAVRSEATLLSHAGSDHRLKINKDSDADTASLLFQSNWAGHAEMGLAGDTDFALKVSGNGVDWTDALRFDAATGQASGAAVQSTATDTRPGALLAVGAFGLGSTGNAPFLTDLDAVDMAGGTYRYNQSTAGSRPAVFPTDIEGSVVLIRTTADCFVQYLYGDNATGGAVFYRMYQAGLWTAWAQFHTSQSLVGPVAETGGLPTGAVIERGSNSLGDYLKLADGTMMTWQEKNLGSGIAEGSGTWSSPYSTGVQGILLPATFIAPPIPAIAFDNGPGSNGNTRAIIASFAKIRNHDILGFRAKRLGDNSSDVEVTAYVTAAGRWF